MNVTGGDNMATGKSAKNVPKSVILPVSTSTFYRAEYKKEKLNIYRQAATPGIK